MDQFFIIPMAKVPDTVCESEEEDADATGFLMPYLFEPLGKVGSDASSSCSSFDHSRPPSPFLTTTTRRTSPDDWCKCGNCQQKMSQQECVCCVELQDCKKILEAENLA